MKYYLIKYFFLLLGFLQWVISCVLLFIYGVIFFNLIAVGFLVSLGLILVYLFSRVHAKIKRVRIGYNKLVIINSNGYVRVGWPEIKSFQHVPFVKLCKLKIKGQKGSLYFLPAGGVEHDLEHYLNQTRTA